MKDKYMAEVSKKELVTVEGGNILGAGVVLVAMGFVAGWVMSDAKDDVKSTLDNINCSDGGRR